MIHHHDVILNSYLQVSLFNITSKLLQQLLKMHSFLLPPVPYSPLHSGRSIALPLTSIEDWVNGCLFFDSETEVVQIKIIKKFIGANTGQESFLKAITFCH